MSLGPRLTTSVQRPISIPSPSRARSLGEQPNFPPGTIKYPCPRMIQRSSARSSTASQNCSGLHKTKNCSTFPCVKCKATGKPDEHSQRLCPDKGGYPQLPWRANSAHRQFTPHPHYLLNPDQSLVVYPNHPLPTTHCSLIQPRPPTPPRSVFFHPDTSYVPPRYSDEDFHYSDGTYEDEDVVVWIYYSK